MKRILLVITFITALIVVSAQKSIDALFDKYACQDGFVTVTINGDLLKLSDLSDDDDFKTANITGIRILAQEDDNLKVENFYDMVIKDINLNHYEEFMRVKESDQDVRMLVRTEGDKFKEFLLIAGGDDNVLIQIKGNMNLAEARKFSEKARKENGINIVTNH